MMIDCISVNDCREEMSDMLKYVGGASGAVTLGAVTATAAAWYYMSRLRVPHFSVDLNNQTREVPVSDKRDRKGARAGEREGRVGGAGRREAREGENNGFSNPGKKCYDFVNIIIHLLLHTDYIYFIIYSGCAVCSDVTAM